MLGNLKYFYLDYLDKKNYFSERSRSEGEMLKKTKNNDYDNGVRDIDASINHSTYSVPLQLTSKNSKKKKQKLHEYCYKQSSFFNENNATNSIDSTSLNDLSNAIKASISVDNEHMPDDKTLFIETNYIMPNFASTSYNKTQEVCILFYIKNNIYF